MGCIGSSEWKPSIWKHCTDSCCMTGAVEPMAMPGNPVRMSNYNSPSRGTSMNASQSPSRSVQPYPSPPRSNYLLGLGSPPQAVSGSGPTGHCCQDPIQAMQQQGPPHSLHCKRRTLMLHKRQIAMLAHQQQLVFVPHIHLHNLPLPCTHPQQGSYDQTPYGHHHPNRRSSQYYGQGYIVAHHKHHHHVNFQ